VHRQPLLDQWAAQLALFLGLDAKEIGRIGGGRHKANGRSRPSMAFAAPAHPCTMAGSMLP